MERHDETVMDRYGEAGLFWRRIRYNGHETTSDEVIIIVFFFALRIFFFLQFLFSSLHIFLSIAM